MVWVYHAETEAFLDVAETNTSAELDTQRTLTLWSHPTGHAGSGPLMTKGGVTQMWELEFQDPKSGGQCTWGASYRLKHVNTGMYLALDESPPPPPNPVTTEPARSRLSPQPLKPLYPAVPLCQFPRARSRFIPTRLILTAVEPR